MTEPTPRDFLIHLNQNNFQAALDLADDLQLDKDLVYKAQWTKRIIERGSQLQPKDAELLNLIHDDAWVISQCLEVCVNEPTVQQTILSIAEARIQTLTIPIIDDKHLNTPQAAHSLTAQEKTLLRCRALLLRYKDRLHTLEKIWPSLSSATHQHTGDASFATAYAQFRDSNMIAQAIEYARSENNVALNAIFMHHGIDVLPHRLFILSQIPETADFTSFDLPHVTHDHEDTWPEEPWRDEKDIVEQEWVQALIHVQVPEETEYLDRLKGGIETTTYPASASVIADWYMDRAYAADAIGLSSNALEICRCARVMGVSGMDEHVSEYEWLCKYIYRARATSDQEETYVDLKGFRQMSSYAILDGLLSTTNAANIVDDMLRLALPWLAVAKKRQQGRDQKEDNEFLLYRWLLDPAVVDAHLDWCCVVFEHSKPTIAVEDRIIKDDLDLSRLVLAIVYSGNGSMEYLVRLFECLPIFDEIDDTSSDPTDMATIIPSATSAMAIFLKLQSVGAFGLTQMMDTLQNHLGSAETLARYNASVPLRWYLEDHSVEVQRQLCVRMSSQAAGGVESGGIKFDRDDDWRELLDDMLRLKGDGQGVFGKLEHAEILEIFFSSLLRCGRFKLAKELILGSNKIIDITKAEHLVIDAEREFFDNATSGNMNSGSMKQAWECLKILPPTTEIKKEMDLIEATHSIIHEYKVQDRPGITLMPIQIRQSHNRLELISKLINNRTGMYQQHEQVLALVRKLGYGNDLLAKVKTLAMLASAALVEGDYLASYRLCQITTMEAVNKETDKHHNKQYYDDVHQSAWQICFNLGKVQAFDDISRRLDVLSMALSLSPAENIGDILTVWRKLDANTPSQIALAQLSAANNSQDQNPSSHHQSDKGWHGLLQNATKQWKLGDLLATGGAGEQHNGAARDGDAAGGGKRKRDILRDTVGGWLFQ
ncbi:sec39-domain-containing protein [Mucor ambiguus]|uniref:Sec39-domain-containing protein n=1 Tax=Mucor ambiguus TaxID=91626 RepID=A0A0C9MPE7_9FUNG|nr:sec39-domain-containing protein [Mucor ambiguus]